MSLTNVILMVIIVGLAFTIIYRFIKKRQNEEKEEFPSSCHTAGASDFLCRTGYRSGGSVDPGTGGYGFRLHCGAAGTGHGHS